MNFTIKLNKRKSKKTKRGYPIIVYLTHNYKEKEWRTGYYANLNTWNEKLASPNHKHPEYYHLLDYINLVRSRISEVQLESKKRQISLDEAKSILFDENRDSFVLSAINSFSNDYKGTEWSAVRSFDKFYPYSTYNNVTHEVALAFRNELLKKGNKPSGVDSYIRSLKAIWNRLSKKPNPFKGITTHIPETIKTVASKDDILKLVHAELPTNEGFSGYCHYRNYWLLMFYLGGIDPEVLSKLRYDEHLINGRIIFNRNKGNSKTRCNNIVPKQALDILKGYRDISHPYFVPIFKAADYKTFSGNFSRRLKELCRRLGLSVELRPKSARYTFIDRAQQLLVDERVTAQIVGHKRKTTTSIYTNDFPLKVQDDSHLSIITV